MSPASTSHGGRCDTNNSPLWLDIIASGIRGRGKKNSGFRLDLACTGIYILGRSHRNVGRVRRTNAFEVAFRMRHSAPPRVTEAQKLQLHLWRGWSEVLVIISSVRDKKTRDEKSQQRFTYYC